MLNVSAMATMSDALRRNAPRNGGVMIMNRCNERRRRSIESRRVKQQREIGRKSKKISDLAAPQICSPQKKWLCGSRVSHFEQSPNVAANEKSPDGSSQCSHDCTPTDPKSHCTVVWSNAAYRSELNSDGGSTSSSERHLSDGLAEASINHQRGDSDISGGDRNCSFNGNADILDFRSPEPGYGTGESVGSVAVVDYLGSLSSTKKALIEYPEFRDAEGEDRREDLSPTVRCDKSGTKKSLIAASDIENYIGEGWVHGPECDIENDLCLAKLEADLEDEFERRLEEELQTDIAALSQKLAHLYARQEAKQIDLGNAVLKSTSLATQSKGYTSKVSKNIFSGKPLSAKFLRSGTADECMVQEAKVKRPVKRLVKEADSKRKHTGDKANQGMQGKVVPKGDKADQCLHVLKSGHDTVCGKTVGSLRTHEDLSKCIEEQLQNLKVSPFFWRKKFDWVKSLRSGGLGNPAPEVEFRKEGITRTVLAEKNGENRLRNANGKHERVSRRKKNLLQENRMLQGPSAANKLPRQPTLVAKSDAIKIQTKPKQLSTASPGKAFK